MVVLFFLFKPLSPLQRVNFELTHSFLIWSSPVPLPSLLGGRWLWFVWKVLLGLCTSYPSLTILITLTW